MKLPLVVAFLASACFSSCTSPNSAESSVGSQYAAPSSVGIRSDVTVATPPYTAVETEWKERMDQPYVFLEIVGPYEQTGRFMSELSRHLKSQGLRAEGPPFALYYDDPMRVQEDALRSRLAIPVAPGTPVAAPLGYAVLVGGQVMYSRVAGPYDEVSLAYPAMFAVMRERNWVLAGPIREIYQVDPASVRSFAELVTEIQMPWRPL